ncbi:MAG: hypothetical protein ACRD9L_15730, partial [Bryobacteraceae bacterium]
HDAVLHHFLLGHLEQARYVEEFAYNYGEWTRDLGQTLWRDRARSAVDPRYFEYPMLRRAAERAQAVVVHNPAAAAIAARHAPLVRIVEIPHLFTPPKPPEQAAVARLRRQMNLGHGAFLFAAFGHLRESKRIESVLAAFHRVHREHPQAALLIAGDFVSTDLARVLEEPLKGPGIHRVGFTPESDFWRYAAAADACVNLRYPAAGETSGISTRLMGIGKTVLVTHSEETARIPEGACLRVDAGAAEVEMLARYMCWLVQAPGAAAEIGARAAAHIAAYHSLDRVAQSYWRVLEDSR